MPVYGSKTQDKFFSAISNSKIFLDKKDFGGK